MLAIFIFFRLMIFFTQLVYVKKGKEDTFEEFESVAIPLIQKHNGRLLLCLRPSSSSIVETLIEHPYEMHFGEFETEEDFENFLNDDERQKILKLKEESIEYSFVVKGEKL